MRTFNTFLLMASTPIVKNGHINSCRNCIHYKPSDSYSEFATTLNECTKFAEKDIITGKITNEYANICRREENMCGKNGKYFEEEPNLLLKIANHKLRYYTPSILLLASFLFYAYVKSLTI